ncbi:MAG TPA: ABC transporter permease [Terriglobales bacterium]|nr:ABC transporter permease [Terriglobales bacterium]
MVTGEIWRVALDALRANKVKAALTMLGVVIGSACIVLVVTVSLTGKRYIISQIEGVGANLVYAYYVAAGPLQARPIADEISLADMQQVRQQIPQVAEVAGTSDTLLTIPIAGKERAVSLIGVTEGFQKIRNLEVLRGRFLDEIDMQSRAKACVITKNLAALLPYQDPVGHVLRVGELDYTIVGVFRERVATFGQSEITSESIVIPFPLMNSYSGQDFLKVLYAQADRPEDVPEVTRRVGEIIRSRHRPGAVYSVENLSSILDAARTISFALTLVLLVIASMALVISGIGIMNIMLVTVTQRTREIGVRMAVGARRREIQYQFLMEALLISGTGAITGIAIAVSIPLFLRPLLPDNMNMPISALSVVISFFVSSVTGIIFGYIPANRASKLQPTESLHHE